MNFNHNKNNHEIHTLLKSLEFSYKHLDKAFQNSQSPNTKRKIINIIRMLQLLLDDVEEMESKHFKFSKNKEYRKMMIKDEGVRTNYNHNADGRIYRANYSGHGDMKRIR